MSEISNKAIIIAVSLLVTIAITSSIITVIGFFKEIYAEVDKTDISLRKMFNEYDIFDNTVMTGLDIENAYYKYIDDPIVNIKVDGNKINSISYDKKTDKQGMSKYYLKINEKSQGLEKQDFYARKYNVTCERIGDGATITFTRSY